MTASFWGLVAIGGVVWYLRSSLRAREIAVAAGHRLCREQGVQLLDQTVALRGMRPRWRRGQVYWRRRYSFDFSTDMQQRSQGALWLFGTRVERAIFDTPQDGRIIVECDGVRQASDASSPKLPGPDQRTPPAQ